MLSMKEDADTNITTQHSPKRDIFISTTTTTNNLLLQNQQRTQDNSIMMTTTKLNNHNNQLARRTRRRRQQVESTAAATEMQTDCANQRQCHQLALEMATNSNPSRICYTTTSVLCYNNHDEQSVCEMLNSNKNLKPIPTTTTFKTRRRTTTTTRQRGSPLNGGKTDRRRRLIRTMINCWQHHLILAICLLACVGMTKATDSLTVQTTTTTSTTTPATTLTRTSESAINLLRNNDNEPQQQLTANSTKMITNLQRREKSDNNLNNGDINNVHRHQLQQQQASIVVASEQNQPIEQIAKAEALTSAESSPPSMATASAAALQQQQQQSSSAKLFEMCKFQSKISQQLTNLSQIVFHPSDICSSWSKMSKTTIDSTTEAALYPWFYIEQLNLSHNNLTVLHDSSGLSRMNNLIELKITHNQLSRCEESSLAGLHRLQILDLSHNKLQALPAKFFQSVKLTIKKLNLSFNSITVLPPTLFDSLNQLEYLDLSHNEITSHWFNDRLFRNLTQLRYLDLSFNKLTVFSSPMAFSSLQQLETLSLQHNELRQVPETIQHLKYLSSLDLSQNYIHDITNASYLSNCRLLFNLNLESNSLENITRDAFSDLPALKVLNLANNRIHHLDQQAFDYVPDLHALRLDSNRLIDFGQAFVNLSFLLMLNISSNRISSFDYAQIPLGLQWLDLHSNRIDKLNNFYYSPSAMQQYPATNDISGQQQASSIGQHQLTTLDASYNLIRELDNSSLPESLETVQLNNNQIRTISSHTFSTKSNLTRINLSHNQLSTMPFDSLRMQNNRDTQQQQQQSSAAAPQQQKFVDIYLANNPFVCNCNMGWLSQLLLASSNLMQGVNSGTNLLNTLPREHAFTDTYGLILSRQLPRVADAQMIQCHLPFGRQSAPLTADPHQWSPILAANQLALHHNHHSHSRETPLILRQSELLSSVHLCPYKSHCFAMCYCCEFDACDCEMSCPEGCSCYYDQTWTTNIVDCSANNQINGVSQARFTQMMMGANNNHQRQPSLSSQQQPQLVKFSTIPEKIPMDVTELYLDGLELIHLRGNALIGRRNLKSLFLNNSQLVSIEPKALATQKSLRVLQLNSNQLTTLHGYEFEQQVELRELYLAHNRLTSIANMTFAPLKSLQILHLQNNQLYHMNFWSNIPAGHKLVSLNLGQNPWSCQCDFIEPMLEWLRLNTKHLHDRKSVSCQYNQTTSLHLLPPLLSSSNGVVLSSDSENHHVPAIYGSSRENYPLFDMRMCLNYTVQQNSLLPAAPLVPPSPFDFQQPPPRPEVFPPATPQFEDTTIINSNFNQPNDEPLRNPYNPFQPDYPHPQPPPIPNFGNGGDPDNTISSGHGFQIRPDGSNSRGGQILSLSFLFGLIAMILIMIVAVLPLIHYRRSMRKWFYSNYGLNMFSQGSKSSKHHHHAVGSMGKHANPHLHHQYGASSAASTSSSSAASSNLSQALCQQQSSNNSSSGGLVTTPLIVTNNNNINSNHQISNTTAYSDDSRLFDAYLTYSKLDEQFVNDYIAPELEYGQPSYRVALHYRDLPVTTNEFLADCIIETANASRRIIMVISEQLLTTEWLRYEFRAAHLEALKNHSHRQRLIVIMLGQPNVANLDPDLMQCLKSCTCLQWGDKMFWERLRLAMPELMPPSGQQQQYLRYQTLAPHQTGATRPAGNTIGHSKGNGANSKQKLASNLFKSTGLFGGGTKGSNTNAQLAFQQQQLVASNSMHHQQQHHQSLTRPLPHQPSATATAANSALYQTPEEHHYAHLTPSTMIYNKNNNTQRQQQQQQQHQLGHAYHQPIYGDPQQQQLQLQQQQQQQQQQCNGSRDNTTVPVHI